MNIENIKKVSCVGAGVIGYSFALTFALKNFEVGLYDINEDALKLAKERIDTSINLLIKNNVVKEEEKNKIKARINYTTSMEEAVSNASFIQESGPENYDIKHSIIKEIEKYAPKEAIIASSTSGLLITEIAKYAQHKERFIGGHPYNPPHLIPLIEITKGEATAKETIEIAKKFYEYVGKEPIVLQKEALGFICNRIQMAVYREICELVMRGVCTIEDADKAVTYGPGIRWGIMGPSLIFQLGGGKVGVEGLMKHLNSSINLWLKDMASWEEFPKEFAEIAQKGVNQEIENRPKEIGNTIESLQDYRDSMLITLLKLHNKL